MHRSPSRPGADPAPDTASAVRSSHFGSSDSGGCAKSSVGRISKTATLSLAPAEAAGSALVTTPMGGRTSSAPVTQVLMVGLPDPAEFTRRRPVPQIAWFVFAGVVATTVGVVSEFYPGQGAGDRRDRIHPYRNWLVHGRLLPVSSNADQPERMPIRPARPGREIVQGAGQIRRRSRIRPALSRRPALGPRHIRLLMRRVADAYPAAL